MSDFLTEKNKKTGILGKLKWILYVFFILFSLGAIGASEKYIRGMSYSEIAREMKCSTSGVRWNFQEMITRAGYSCKEDLIAAALESKLIVTTLK